jgi:hypothetical protein
VSGQEYLESPHVSDGLTIEGVKELLTLWLSEVVLCLRGGLTRACST